MKMTEIPVGHVAQMVEHEELLLRGYMRAVWLTGSARMATEPVELFANDYEDLGPFEEVFARRNPETGQSVRSDSGNAKYPDSNTTYDPVEPVGGFVVRRETDDFPRNKYATGQPVRSEVTENSLKHEIASLTAMYQSLSERVSEGELDRAGLRYTMNDLRDDVELDRGNVAKMSEILSTFQEYIDELTTEVKALQERVAEGERDRADLRSALDNLKLVRSDKEARRRRIDEMANR